MKRENSQRRRPGSRELADRILIVCGGVVTEPGYFEGLRQLHRNPAIKVVIKNRGVDPTSLVRYAIKLHDNEPDSFDQVWCIVDVDEFDLGPALALAARKNISMAVSNPCFETWLVLHFTDHTAPLSCYAEAKRALLKFVPDYGKSELEFARYADGVGPAVDRAEKLAELGREHLTNPASGVWPLVQMFGRAM
ncbi:MAG TPA: RloB family protein [Pseudonocardiaceae bacterium]